MTVGGISATGVYVPPLFIFPRQQVQEPVIRDQH